MFIERLRWPSLLRLVNICSNIGVTEIVSSVAIPALPSWRCHADHSYTLRAPRSKDWEKQSSERMIVLENPGNGIATVIKIDSSRVEFMS